MLKKLMDGIKKITDIIMPLEPYPEDEDFSAKKAEPTQAEQPVQAQAQAPAPAQTPAQAQTAGGNVAYAAEKYPSGYVNTSYNGTTSVNGVRYTAYAEPSAQESHPKNAAPPELLMKIYKPADYSLVKEIANDILARKAVVVNYEYLEPDGQLRICDFIDGTCFAIDGDVTKISEKIYLYVPPGVETGDLAAMAAAAKAAARFH